LVGDPVYGRRGCPAGLTAAQREAWTGFGRQALHAASLRFAHPLTAEPVSVSAPVPADLAGLIETLAPPGSGHD
jgi:23S rRNA pseudouridine1911/1915/1917 synthase